MTGSLGTTRPDGTRSPLALLVTLAIFGAMFSAVIVCAPALATSYDFCLFQTLPSGADCSGPRHSLTASQAYSDGSSRPVCAAALSSPGVFYGAYACGTGFAEHCYSGSNLLYPDIHNHDSLPQGMHGTGFYSESCP